MYFSKFVHILDKGLPLSGPATLFFNIIKQVGEINENELNEEAKPYFNELLEKDYLRMADNEGRFKPWAGDKELYRCPKCGHKDYDDAAEGFWEKGDDVWDCPKCGERIEIEAASRSANLQFFDQFMMNPQLEWRHKFYGMMPIINELRAKIIDGKITCSMAIADLIVKQFDILTERIKK